jgi:hypothetical protein
VYIKIVIKVRQRRHRKTPLFDHIGDEISKNRRKKKMYNGLQGGHETEFSSKFGVKLWFATVLSVPERFQSITAAAAAVCTL